MNFAIIAIAALIPMLLGYVWYHPILFGKTWSRVSGVSEEKTMSAHVWVTFLLTYIFLYILGLALQTVVIHQYHLYSILANEPGIWDPKSEMGMLVANFMEKYGHNFRTFKHGALHGTLAGFTIALPVLAVNALFERKGFKYIAINAGYWIVSMALMGGVICQFEKL